MPAPLFVLFYFALDSGDSFRMHSLTERALLPLSEKKQDRKYGEHVRHIEHASFTLLVFMATRGVGKFMSAFL